MAGPTPSQRADPRRDDGGCRHYVVARLYDVFLAAPTTLAVMAVIAAVTMLGAALAALAQDDIKRVLAWSTVSQLAYMLGALAVGRTKRRVPPAHARRVQGAAVLGRRRRHPCRPHQLHAGDGRPAPRHAGDRSHDDGGLAALAGIPPFSGFFSKEAILGAAEEAAHGHGPGRVVGPGGWCCRRARHGRRHCGVRYAALGHDRSSPNRVGRARRTKLPAAMRWPLVVLAVPALLLGFAGLRTQWMPTWVDKRPRAAVRRGPVHAGAVPPRRRAILGSPRAGRRRRGAGLVPLASSPGADPARALGRARPAFARGFFVDDLYDAALVRPTRALARVVRTGDNDVVDAYVPRARASAPGCSAVPCGSRRPATVQDLSDRPARGVVVLAVAGAVALS
jgi:NADH-quinone oxidoreductase subunit L